jgi:SP family galactose:H+ symporter-like MFS transporter
MAGTYDVVTEYKGGDQEMPQFEEGSGGSSTWATLSKLPSKTKLFVIRAGLVGSLGGFLFGYDLGSVAGALPQLESEFGGLSSNQLDFVVSIMLFGAVIGSMVGGIACDAIGRWKTIMGTCVVFVLGGFLLQYSQTVVQIYLGRVTVGVGIALSAVADVSYLSELSPANLRGAMVSLNEVMVSFGILGSFFVSWLLRDSAHGWRLMFGSGAFLAILQGALMLSLPESPKWLVAQGREAEARAVLCRMYSEEEAWKELESLHNSLEACGEGEAHPGAGSTGTLLREWRPQLVAAMVLTVFQQLTSNSNVLSFAPEIYEAVGLRTSSYFATVVLGMNKCIFTLLVLQYIDKVGRKTLVISGGAVIAGSLCALSLSAFAYDRQEGSSVTGASITTFAATLCVTGAYAVSYGPLTWLIIAESFPSGLKSHALGICQVVNWLMQACVSAGFLSIIKIWGTGLTFTIFASLTMLGVYLVHRFVPETLGKEPDQIRAGMQEGWASPIVAYTPTIQTRT